MFQSAPDPRGRPAKVWAVIAFLAAAALALGAEQRRFSIPAGPAEKSLRQLATQSGIEVVYPAEVVRGVRTAEVKGRMTPGEALGRLLTGTGLDSTRDAGTGAFSLSRGSDPNDSRAAQKTPSDRPKPANSSPKKP